MCHALNDAGPAGYSGTITAMRAMTRQEALDFLGAGARTGKLATASPTGAVHVAPVWFVLAEGDLVFTTNETTVKARHLSANPRAALTVDNEGFPHDFVHVRGPVSVDRSAPDLGVWARRIAERYVPPGQGEAYGRRNGVPGEWLCRMAIQRLVGQWALAY